MFEPKLLDSIDLFKESKNRINVILSRGINDIEWDNFRPRPKNPCALYACHSGISFFDGPLFDHEPIASQCTYGSRSIAPRIKFKPHEVEQIRRRVCQGLDI